MQINISGRHMEITPAIRDYCNSKLGKLSNYHDRIVKTDIVLSVEKLIRKAEARVFLGGPDLYADSESDDMYAAIDALSDKLSRQLSKHKEKLQNHR